MPLLLALFVYVPKYASNSLPSAARTGRLPSCAASTTENRVSTTSSGDFMAFLREKGRRSRPQVSHAGWRNSSCRLHWCWGGLDSRPRFKEPTMTFSLEGHVAVVT